MLPEVSFPAASRDVTGDAEGERRIPPLAKTPVQLPRPAAGCFPSEL